MYFLRFVFNPTDASVANLANEKVAPHAGSIIRLMHALDVSAAGPLWRAALDYLTTMLSSRSFAVLEYWLPLADEINAKLAWAAGIRQVLTIEAENELCVTSATPLLAGRWPRPSLLTGTDAWAPLPL